jgi:hypothetical protein
MAQGVPVGRVGQRSQECPLLAALSQAGEVLANLNPGRRCLDWLERTTDTIGGVRFEVKAFVLGKATRQKDVEDRLCAARAGTDDLLVGCSQSTEVIRTQAEKSQGAGLYRCTAWNWNVTPNTRV